MRIVAGAFVVASASIVLMAPLAAADSQTPLRGELEGSVEEAPCGPATLCLTGTAEGVVSHLGRTTLTKSATIHFTGESCPGGGSASTYTEDITLVGANGDALHMSGEGTACAAAGHAIGTTELTVTGGTGRFATAFGTVTESLDHDLSDSSEIIRLSGTVGWKP